MVEYDPDPFLEAVRSGAKPLREAAIPDMTLSRLQARIRATVSLPRPSVLQFLASWTRPVGVALAALSFAALLGIGWVGHDHESVTSDSLAATNMEVSLDGDTYSVLD